jgi:3-oxoacyl-[acyl-carrier protein] reductase
MKIGSSVCLVTGGGTGIGRATALELAKQGAGAVAISYNTSREDALRAQQEIQAIGCTAFVIQADVRSDPEVRRMVHSVVDRFRRLDILVNNAGTTTFIPLKELDALTDEVWDSTFETNLRGTFYCSRAAAAELRKSKGAIVNVASIAGLRAAGSSIAYAVSKAGVIHLTRVLAIALAPEIRVNCVAPGMIETRWYDRSPAAGALDAERSRVASETPLARTGKAEDVAVSIVDLLQSDHITGETVVIDGGKGLTY